MPVAGAGAPAAGLEPGSGYEVRRGDSVLTVTAVPEVPVSILFTGAARTALIPDAP